MKHTAFFEKLGVLIVPDFLKPWECAQLTDEMNRAPHSEALLSVRGQSDEVTDARQRSTTRAQVSQETSASMVKRLLASKARVEGFFDQRLANVLEVPKFLIYRPGDFFIPHRDVRGSEEDVKPIMKARRVNLIIGLNEEYSGPGLTLYGLIDEPGWSDYGFPVPCAPGSLVAFRSDVLHEVPPVIEGERYAIVSRMLDPSFRVQPASGSIEGT